MTRLEPTKDGQAFAHSVAKASSAFARGDTDNAIGHLIDALTFLQTVLAITTEERL